ncbi:TPA: hypothetical protein DEP96_02730 [Candidatus Uhrbacteria bacterium]|nr:hypothetical protein [Candidatus Uhrbacteria bacterium]
MNSPQLAVVAKYKTVHIELLLKAAAAQNISTVVITGSAAEVTAQLDALHDAIILWRSGRLTPTRRAEVLAAAETRGCRLINQALLRTPLVRSKRYQQATVQAELGIQGIVTVEFDQLSSLTFPVIAKLPVSSRGAGVFLLSSISEASELSGSVNDYVYQSFIPNNGDYRIFMVGGVPLGVMKRVAKAGEHRNNLAQGGTGEVVTDKHEHATACKLAAKVATIFGLQICGVDLIRHVETGEWYFMEVNTVPQWANNGFQGVTGIDVAAKIINYVAILLRIGDEPMAQTVTHWYESNMEFLPSVAFHWWSRKYLWTLDDQAKGELQQLRSAVFGKTEMIEDSFRSIMSHSSINKKLLKERSEILAKYPQLLQISTVLAKTLFASTIYGEDVRGAALAAIGEEKLRKMWHDLQADEHELLVLSTSAINPLYFISNLFGESFGCILNPLVFVKTLERGVADIDSYRPRDLVYLATHAVIGASKFYSSPITSHRSAYERLLKLAEQVIEQYSDKVPLDAKLEFLVAHRILGTSSVLAAKILASASSSTYPHGVIVSDLHKAQGSNILKAEHRNVLYMMASQPWKKGSGLESGIL